jgi:hypothetical protein
VLLGSSVFAGSAGGLGGGFCPACRAFFTLETEALLYPFATISWGLAPLFNSSAISICFLFHSFPLFAIIPPMFLGSFSRLFFRFFQVIFSGSLIPLYFQGIDMSSPFFRGFSINVVGLLIDILAS